MAFSAERVRPGLPLPLPVTPFSSAANLPTATSSHCKPSYSYFTRCSLSGGGAALWRVRAKPGKRGQEGGVGLFNRPNRLTQSTSALIHCSTIWLLACVCIVQTTRRLKSGAEVPDF